MGGVPHIASPRPAGGPAVRVDPRARVGHLTHLTKRFVTSLSTHAPTAAADAWATSQLLAGEQALWSAMSNQDRRHATVVAYRFLDRAPDAPRAAIAAALLHDCGKTPAKLGTLMRTVATVVGPRGKRFEAYHDHERIGADIARDAGSEPQTVALIARSPDAPPELLSALCAADDV